MMMEERMLEVSPLPQYIQVEVASACNLRCDMCFYHSDRLKDGTLHVKKGDFLDDALIDKVIDEMAAFTDGHCFSKPQFYASTRGEFFLYPKAVELIHKVTSRGIGFYVVTNGTLMNDDAAKALVDCQADQVTVSLDSLTEETGSDIRVGYSQETVEANIDNLVVYRAKSGQKKPFISLCFTDVGRNSHEIDGYIKKWKDKVDQIFVQNEAAFDEQRGARYWTRKRWDLPVEKRDVCLALVNSVAIMADGTVHACTGGDYKDDTVLGHIENDTIAACFRSARKDTLMAAHLNRDFQNLHVCGVCEKWKTYQSRFLKYEGDWSMSRDSIATLVLQPNKKSA
jgi:MoaA/NifB/PqqE/SkfB family radical SAM enzyme